MKTFAALVVAGAAASVSAQSLNINIIEGPADFFTMFAVLNNPAGTIRAVISDLAFTITASNITNFSYNPAFDSTFFGPATVNVTSTSLDFSGTNTLPPLGNPGGPDQSNPLQIATFNATSWITNFEINGQMTGAYVGVPFDNVFFYQNADGSPGSVPFRLYYYPPAPGSASLLALAGIGTMRRRR